MVELGELAVPVLVADDGAVAGIRATNGKFRLTFLGMDLDQLAEQVQLSMLRESFGFLLTPAPVPTAVAAETEELPSSFGVTAYPNPFNSSVSIVFDLPSSDEIELGVYNLAGQKVATLGRDTREAGTYTLKWNGRDDHGRELASGVYLYRLSAGERVETRKLLLLR